METGFKLDMANMPPIALAALMGAGLSWSIAYILIIRRSALDKTFGVPMTGMCANFAWEFIVSFVIPHPFPIRYCNYAWLLLDCVLVYQFLRYGRGDFVRNLSVRWFYPVFLGTLAMAFISVLVITRHFDDEGWHAAFLCAVITSLLYIAMLLRRNSLAGQSLPAAVLRLVGTQSSAIGFSLLFPVPPLFLLLVLQTALFDLIYIAMLYAKSRQVAVAVPARN